MDYQQRRQRHNRNKNTPEGIQVQNMADLQISDSHGKNNDTNKNHNILCRKPSLTDFLFYFISNPKTYYSLLRLATGQQLFLFYNYYNVVNFIAVN